MSFGDVFLFNKTFHKQKIETPTAIVVYMILQIFYFSKLSSQNTHTQVKLQKLIKTMK